MKLKLKDIVEYIPCLAIIDEDTKEELWYSYRPDSDTPNGIIPKEWLNKTLCRFEYRKNWSGEIVIIVKKGESEK
jgi:hypothetical protein